MARHWNALVALVVLLPVTSGCSGTTAVTGGTPAPAPARSMRALRAEDLLDPAVKDGMLLEAILRLRPNFLITRGTLERDGTPIVLEVSLNNGPLGPLSNLTDIRANTVQSVTLFTAAEAGQRFGLRERFGPVLLVLLK